jgi:hypothetical protein
MATYSPGRLARRLGVSRHRIERVAAALGVGSRTRGRLLLTDAEADRIAAKIGVGGPVAGLSRSQALVLAVLASRPQGVVSARAVARLSGLSPTTASTALKALAAQNLTTTTREVVLDRWAAVRTVTRANTSHPDWPRLAEALAGFALPKPAPASRVPASLRYAFWNADEETFRNLSPVRDGTYIAYRALTSGDPDLLAFAADQVPRTAWEAVAGRRGLTAEQVETALACAKDRP